jgi:hypothetical protein
VSEDEPLCVEGENEPQAQETSAPLPGALLGERPTPQGEEREESAESDGAP